MSKNQNRLVADKTEISGPKEVTQSNESVQRCPKCNYDVKPNWKKCIECKEPLELTRELTTVKRKLEEKTEEMNKKIEQMGKEIKKLNEELEGQSNQVKKEVFEKSRLEKLLEHQEKDLEKLHERYTSLEKEIQKAELEKIEFRTDVEKFFNQSFSSSRSPTTTANTPRTSVPLSVNLCPVTKPTQPIVGNLVSFSVPQKTIRYDLQQVNEIVLFDKTENQSKKLPVLKRGTNIEVEFTPSSVGNYNVQFLNKQLQQLVEVAIEVFPLPPILVYLEKTQYISDEVWEPVVDFIKSIPEIRVTQSRGICLVVSSAITERVDQYFSNLDLTKQTPVVVQRGTSQTVNPIDDPFKGSLQIILFDKYGQCSFKDKKKFLSHLQKFK